MKIQLNSLSVSAENNTLLELTHTFSPDSVTAVLGKNGAGKSTLLNVIGGVTKPDTGTVSFNERSIEGYSRKDLCKVVSYLPQLVPTGIYGTVYDCIAAGKYPWIGAAKSISPEELQEIDLLLETLRLTHLKDRSLSTLSGGERQRTLLGSALAQNTPILLLDEPDAHLDPFQEEYLFSVIKELAKKEKKTVLIVSHAVSLVQKFSDYAIGLDNGKLCWSGPVTELHDAEIKKIYGF